MIQKNQYISWVRWKRFLNVRKITKETEASGRPLSTLCLPRTYWWTILKLLIESFEEMALLQDIIKDKQYVYVR